MSLKYFLVAFFTSVGLIYTARKIQEHFNWFTNLSDGYIFVASLILAIVVTIRKGR
jgi:hypothetical protein